MLYNLNKLKIMNPNTPDNVVAFPGATKTDLVQYVRGKNGARIGVVVARNYNGRVTFGWSAARQPVKATWCSGPRDGDLFDKERALEIAFARTLVGSKVQPPRPVAKVLAGFPERAERYYKGAEIVAIASSVK